MPSESVYLAIVTGLIGAFTLYVNKHHDSKILKLELQNEDQERRLGISFVQHQECKDEHKATQIALEDARRELAEKTAAENKRLQDQIDVLKRITRSNDT